MSYPNGSKLTVAKVDGDPPYQEMLGRLSLASSQHPSYAPKHPSLEDKADRYRPPYNNFDESLRDMPRQAKRRARKAAGIPASKDVGALSSVLKPLRDAVQRHLGYKVCSATAAATPHLLALYEEDMLDTFEYLGLRHLRLLSHADLLYESSAAYAGHGLGLCSDYSNYTACKDEEKRMPGEEIMAILYTRSALTVTFSGTKSAYYLWEPPYRHLEDFSLGHAARHDNPSEEFYWAAVRDRIQELILQNHNSVKPGKVLLFGECATDAKFTETVHDALESVMEERPEIMIGDIEGIAAIGTAEMAKRAQWDP